MKYTLLILALYLPSLSAMAGGFDTITPKPVKTAAEKGALVLTEAIPIHVEEAGMMKAAEGLADLLHGADTRINALVRCSTEKPAAGGITIRADKSEAIGPEGYRLDISEEGMLLGVRQPAGIFYAGQTLLQLIEKSSEGGMPVIPAGHVIDTPRFGWRGLMLDCSRTFLPVDYLKRYIDLLALYKMNTLHLHLTDDQGWRIEIRKYPKLTEVGAQWDSAYPQEKGGFYTQAEIRDLVAYAQARYITIIPEIELPGHCLAALKAYPELACHKEEFRIIPFLELVKGVQAPYGVFCAGNDAVYHMLEAVLGEIMDIFPSPYIHIGGHACPLEYWDACPKCQARMQEEGLADTRALEPYFIRRVERFITARGRTMLGWDEIAEGSPLPESAIMINRTMDTGVAAARECRNVVIAPAAYCCLDYDYSLTPMEKIYRLNPASLSLDSENSQYILGVEAILWTYQARREADIDAMIWPRLLALAEVAWTPKEMLGLADFKRRVQHEQGRLKALGVQLQAEPCFPAMAATSSGTIWLALPAGTYYWNNGQWSLFPGPPLRSIAVSNTGDLWGIGGAQGDRLVRWNGQSWQENTAPGALRHVAVTNMGQLLITGQDFHWRSYIDQAFQQQPGMVRAVVSGGNAFYALGDTAAEEGYPVLVWTNAVWQDTGGKAVGISAGPDGVLWAVNRMGALWRFAGGQWQGWPAGARAVTVAAADRVYAISTDSTENSWQILRFVNNAWQPEGEPLVLPASE